MNEIFCFGDLFYVLFACGSIAEKKGNIIRYFPLICLRPLKMKERNYASFESSPFSSTRNVGKISSNGWAVLALWSKKYS